MRLRWKIAQAAEIRWWQNYLRNKDTADYHEWKTAYWKQLLTDIAVQVPESKEHTVLDAGCGPAGIFMVFNTQSVTALDPLLDSYKEKIAHFKPEQYPNVCFRSEPLENLQEKEVYDTVFCLNAINHVADLALCFDTLVRSVKRGGKLVVSIDAHNYKGLKKIFQALPGDILHPHQYDLEEYTTMLTERGCELQNTVLYKKEFIFNYYILVLSKEG